MIESSRRHGPFDPRWKPSGKRAADVENTSAATNGAVTGTATDLHRLGRQLQAVAPAQVRGRAAPVERWEDEGGNYAVDNEPDVEVDCAKRPSASLNWDDFLARSFPRRGRHDFPALKAYEAEWQTSSPSEKC